MTLDIGYNPLIKLYRLVWTRMGCCCSKNNHLIAQHLEISDDRSIDHIKNRFVLPSNGTMVFFKEYMDEVTWILCEYNELTPDLSIECDDIITNHSESLQGLQKLSTKNINKSSDPKKKHKIVLELPIISEREYISAKETPRSVLICFVFSIIVLRIKQANGLQTGSTTSKSDIPDIFNESLFPFTDYNPRFEENFSHINIEQTSIYEFIAHLLIYSKFPFEYVIMALIYIERGVKKLGIELFSHQNWRRYTLICIVVALKVWDDLGVWNSDFSHFLGITLDNINRLESTYLNLIDFNLDIPFSVYISYYFAFQDVSNLLKIIIPLELQDMNRFACLNKKRSIYAKKLTCTHFKFSNSIG